MGVILPSPGPLPRVGWGMDSLVPCALGGLDDAGCPHCSGKTL